MYLSNFSVSLVIVAASSMSFDVEAIVDNGLVVDICRLVEALNLRFCETVS